MTETHVAGNAGRTLSKEGKEQFAYELALGYFDPEQMRLRFKLLPHAFEKYCNDADIHAMVLLKRREIDESDFALKLLARRSARIALENCLTIMKDPDAPAKTRMEAGKQIREMAQGVDKKELKGDEPGEKPVVIRTNLDLDGAKGVYQVTATDVEEQMKVNDAEKAAAISAQDAENVDDEIAALLGV